MSNELIEIVGERGFSSLEDFLRSKVVCEHSNACKELKLQDRRFCNYADIKDCMIKTALQGYLTRQETYEGKIR